MSSKKEKKSKEMLAVPKAPESVEILNLTITDLSRKLAQSNEKIKLLTKTNETLSQDLGTVSGDKDDIISYLKTVISTHEMTISNLEKKLSDSDQSQKDLVKTNEAQIKLINDAHTIQVEKVSMELQAARLELSDLSKFTLEKQELYTQLKTTKALLEKTEVEYRTTIHALERKITLDKSTLKKEMIMRLNESVASFRKVADSQMAETTKRALRENMSVTAQLRRMSDKVVQVVGENDALKRRVIHLKRKNELLAESEKILAAKSLSYQNTIKLIYQKLKESDQILELAFEENAAVYEQNADQILTEEMKREIADLQDDYNQLVERITAVNLLGLDIEFLVDEARDALQSSTEGEIVEYMEESLMVIVKK